MQSIAKWAYIENIFMLFIACGLSAGFFIYTGSYWSYLWLLVLTNLNTVKQVDKSEK